MSEVRFEDIPNEVILTISSFLDIKELIQFAQVSSRIRAICHDESLWKKINLYLKTIPTELIEYILVNGGCKYLSLWSADMVGDLNLNQRTSLKYLDLNFCGGNGDVFTNLISACDSLEKLSLKNATLNKEMINAISKNGKTLQVLNLEGCRGFISKEKPRLSGSRTWNTWGLSNEVVAGMREPIQPIIQECTELVEFNLGSTGLSEFAINYLSENLKPKIQRLSLSELEFVCDNHITSILRLL